MTRNAAERSPATVSAGSAEIGQAARRSLDRVVAAGRENYCREKMLPRLIRATPAELDDGSATMQRTILTRLARALRAERNRGRAGHWTYDLNRHIGLKQAYDAERQKRPGRENSRPGQIEFRDERMRND